MSRTWNQITVRRVAGWPGWCSPCASEDRPLVLTRTGPTGLGAWLAGLGDDDRSLLLTCNVCGHWQVVPPRDEDDPEVVIVEDDLLESVHQVLVEAQAEPTVAVAVVVDLAAAEDDPVCVSIPAPRRPVAAPAFSPEAVAAAAAVLSAARAQTQRTAPRAAAPRPAPLDRSRRTRSTASARRTVRPTAARAPRAVAPATATSIVLPVASSASLVLAAAG